MTARDEILAALPAVLARTADETFGVSNVLRELHERGTGYADSTIGTHVASYMCTNAPQHHDVKYHDLERLSPGRYRIRPKAQ